MRKIILYQNKETQEQRYRVAPIRYENDWVVGKTITDENGEGKWEIIEALEVDKNEVPRYEKEIEASLKKVKKKIRPKHLLVNRASLGAKRRQIIQVLKQAGPHSMKELGVELKDFEFKNISQSMTQLIVNDRSHFVRIIKLNKNNALSFDYISLYIQDAVKRVEMIFSPLDKGYSYSVSNNVIVLLKANNFYTVEILHDPKPEYIFRRVLKLKSIKGQPTPIARKKEQPVNYDLMKLFIDQQVNTFKIEDSKGLKTNFVLESELGRLLENEKIEYKKLKLIVRDYIAEENIQVPYSLLSKYIPDQYIIQLWEDKVINNIDLELLTNYFLKSTADTKSKIIERASKKTKIKLIDSFYSHLERMNGFDRVSNNLKAFLRSISSVQYKEVKDLYETVKQKLFNTLTPSDLIKLWLAGYLDQVDGGIIENEANLDDERLMARMRHLIINDFSGKDLKNNLREVYIKYFMKIASAVESFDIELPKLIKRLEIFRSDYPDDYENIMKLLTNKMSDVHLAVLWSLDVDLVFENSFLKNVEVFEKMHSYFKLKFLLRLHHEKYDTIDNYQKIVSEINDESLRDFANHYAWNSTIYATKILGDNSVISFLDDVVRFNEVFNQNINITNLAESIYHSIADYSIVHLRLWLYHLNANDRYYDLVGINSNVANLTGEERELLSTLLEKKNVLMNDRTTSGTVQPCGNFTESNITDIRVYHAKIENIYFRKEKIQLRLENGNYTQDFFCVQSSIEMNRISTLDPLNRKIINITVERDEIKKVEGLDEIFETLHLRNIELALLRKIDDEIDISEGYEFEEDYKLKKQIIEYLEDEQIYGFEILTVNPAGYYRRRSVSDALAEISKLYTLITSDGYAIVWEYISYIEDRPTYIFKCSKENYKELRQIIEKSISIIEQFRSVMLKSGDEYTLFRRKYGFVTSIRKKYGEKEAFESWKESLQKALNEPIPKVLSEDEETKLADFDFFSSASILIDDSSTRVIKSLATKSIQNKSKLDINSLPVIDHPGQSDSVEETDKINLSLKRLLNALVKFNDYVDETMHAFSLKHHAD